MLPRPGFTTAGPDSCTGYFFAGFRRNLCLPGEFACGWTELDGTTRYLSCSLEAFGEVGRGGSVAEGDAL